MRQRLWWPVLPILLLWSCATLQIAGEAREAFDRGLALFNQGKYEEAIPHFTRATEIEPEYARAYLYLGRSHVSLRRWLQALPPLRTAFRLSPAGTTRESLDILLDALLAAAGDLFRQGDYRGSIQLLQEGLQLAPQAEGFRTPLTDSWLALGTELLARGNPGEALGAFQSAVDLAPERFEGYLGLAKAFFSRGELRQALEAAGAAARLNPSNPEAQMLFRQLRPLQP